VTDPLDDAFSGLIKPSDEVLLELGRLVWAAIDLEGVVYSVCRSVKPRHSWYDDHPINDRDQGGPSRPERGTFG
jgi:hypothetical protein